MNMLSSVSWQQYLVWVMVIIVGYYSVISIAYFRKEIQLFFTTGFKKRLAPHIAPFVGSNLDEAQASVLSSSVHELLDELALLLRKAVEQRYPKEELLTALKMKLSEYKSLKGTQFEILIINHIKSESRVRCDMDFEDSELSHLW